MDIMVIVRGIFGIADSLIYWMFNTEIVSGISVGTVAFGGTVISMLLRFVATAIHKPEEKDS